MNYPLLNVFLTIFWFFAWCVWIFLVVWTIMLIFRRSDLSGWAKAAWLVFVIFLPLLGILAYLIASGGRLADDRASGYSAPQDDPYIHARMGSRGRHSTDELTKLADLRDRGVITNAEFEKGKHQLLG